MKNSVLRRPILGTAAYSLIALLLLAFAAPLQAAVDVQQDASSVTLANSKVVWKFDKAKRWFSIIDAASLSDQRAHRPGHLLHAVYAGDRP